MLTWPASANTFVPALPLTVFVQLPFSSVSVFQLPIWAYHLAPFTRITGIDAYVSTLFTFVEQPQ